jgi:hypothetical protein
MDDPVSVEYPMDCVVIVDAVIVDPTIVEKFA